MAKPLLGAPYAVPTVPVWRAPSWESEPSTGVDQGPLLSHGNATDSPLSGVGKTNYGFRTDFSFFWAYINSSAADIIASRESGA